MELSGSRSCDYDDEHDKHEHGHVNDQHDEYNINNDQLNRGRECGFGLGIGDGCGALATSWWSQCGCLQGQDVDPCRPAQQHALQ